MDKKRVLNIGLIGFGNIGSGVIKTLQENTIEINSRLGAEIKLKRIVDIDINRERPVKVDKELLSTSVNDILYDKEIDIVIELMGGISPAKEYIIESAKNGKHVVSANKEVLSKYGKEIFKIFNESNLSLMFEASVCGGIPIISTLQNNLCANKIHKVMGIVNGTTNYILSNMSEKKTDFKTALKSAQKMGYAEVNPTMDIEGFDALYKIIILTYITYGIFIEDQKIIYKEGINNINQVDIEYAGELGYVLKLLAISKLKDNKLDVRVHPSLLSKSHPLSSVNGVYNAVFIEGYPIGKLMFWGEGAGAKATSSAIISDVISIAESIIKKEKVKKLDFKYNGQFEFIPIDELYFPFYIRFIVEDKPGVLAQIAKIFSDNKISLSSVVQKTAISNKAEIVIITHSSQEKNFRKSIKEIKELRCIKEIPSIIRVEEEDKV